jgi:hypothetical protein
LLVCLQLSLLHLIHFQVHIPRHAPTFVPLAVPCGSGSALRCGRLWEQHFVLRTAMGSRRRQEREQDQRAR